MAKRTVNLKGFSLTFRLSLGMTLLITFLMSVFGFSTYARDRDVFIKQAIDQGWAVARTANIVTGSALKTGSVPLLEDIVKRLNDNPFVSDAAIFDAGGYLVAASGKKHSEKMTIAIGDKIHSPGKEELIPIEGEKGKITALAFMSPIKDGSGKELGHLRLLVDFAEINKNLERTTHQMVISFVAASLAGLILVRLIVIRSVAKPVQSLLAATEKISVGDFTYTLEVFSSDELGKLARSFNIMSDQLRTLFVSVKTIVEDIDTASELILKRIEEQEKSEYEEASPEKRREAIKEINVNAKRLTWKSNQLRAVVSQFKFGGNYNKG